MTTPAAETTTQAEERAVWLAQAKEGLDVVEGVHDEIISRLIAQVNRLEAQNKRLRRGLEYVEAASNQPHVYERAEEALEQPHEN